MNFILFFLLKHGLLLVLSQQTLSSPLYIDYTIIHMLLLPGSNPINKLIITLYN